MAVFQSILTALVVIATAHRGYAPNDPDEPVQVCEAALSAVFKTGDEDGLYNFKYSFANLSIKEIEDGYREPAEHASNGSNFNKHILTIFDIKISGGHRVKQLVVKIIEKFITRDLAVAYFKSLFDDYMEMLGDSNSRSDPEGDRNSDDFQDATDDTEGENPEDATVSSSTPDYQDASDANIPKMPIDWCENVQAKTVHDELLNGHGINQQLNTIVLNDLNEDLDDNFDALVAYCKMYLEGLVIDVTSDSLTTNDVIRTVYEKWSYRTLNYEGITSVIPKIPYTDLARKMMYYIERFSLGYFMYLEEHVLTELRRREEMPTNFKSVKSFCLGEGRRIVLESEV